MGIKLKNRVFNNMFIIAAVCVIISVAVSTVVLYKNVENQIIEGNKTNAIYVKYFVEKYGEDGIYSIEMPEGRRITLISADGSVIYDSMINIEDMENHIDRQEVKEALKNDSGSAKRVSDTLSETTYYYAVKLSDGNILRVATTSDNVYETFKAVIPVTIILTVCILGAALALSEYLTKKIVRPLNTLDINEPDNIVIYDEMAPFVSQIKNQNKVIESQMKDLRGKKIEFETITENMKEGLIVLSRKGHVISYNKSAIKLLSVEIPEEELKSVLLFNRSGKFEKAVHKALNGESGECVLSSGERVCQVMANPVMDNEKTKGAVVLIIDITEKEKREALRREFSANVSHELKTPLTSISGYAEIMKSGMVKSDDMVGFADIIYTEARRLIDLVGDIIKVSKLDEDNISMEESIINIKGLAGDIAKRLKRPADVKGVTIDVSAGEEQPEEYEIMGVSQIVDEMIYNVVDNAIKYNRDGGFVHITVDSDDNNIRLTVKDTGIGIPEADKSRVFERFYRVDKSHSKEVGGTGLGLSIVKHGAAFMGAGVSLESEEGVGTTIAIDFKKNITA